MNKVKRRSETNTDESWQLSSEAGLGERGLDGAYSKKRWSSFKPRFEGTPYAI